jgi:hypothetical protein
VNLVRTALATQGYMHMMEEYQQERSQEADQEQLAQEEVEQADEE